MIVKLYTKIKIINETPYKSSLQQNTVCLDQQTYTNILHNRWLWWLRHLDGLGEQ